ncbi:PAS domain S-box protein [Rhodohalobacter sp. 614A]|uniref:PAS domain S-box protein n=1 Tax=Rhodohalobacter sp. 614A TaxID=2908649 RepID=UPI001F2818FC|nr:PAS domain S-box protein [Rhodohalobacter sp. 614A]
MGKQKIEHLEIFLKCNLGLDGVLKRVPTQFCTFLEYTEQELKTEPFSKWVHPKDQEIWSEFFGKIISEKSGDFESEISLLTKSGDSVSVFISGILIRDEKGNADYIACHIQNLSKQLKIFQKLEEREQQFNSLFRNNPHPVYYFDVEGNFEGVNNKLVEFSGISEKELLSKRFEDFIHEDDLERTKRHFQKTLDGSSGQYEIKVKVKDGVKNIRVTKFPKYSGDNVVGVFGVFQDITKEKKTIQKVKESEERWQQLLRQNPQPVQIVQDGKIVYINQAGTRYYGARSLSELIRKPIMDFVHNDDAEKVLKRKKLLEQNQHIAPAVNKIVLLNGEQRYIEAHSIPISYKGKPAIQTVVHDITDLKQNQEMIGKSLKEKETLLKEIHHRVKNNLAMISSMLELQIMQSTDQSATNALRDSQLRIRSIAMIHEKLYQNESLYGIRFDNYLKELVDTIKQTYLTSGREVDVFLDLDSISLDINQVIPCSLIVNEVVVNSFKHAFNGMQKGALRILMNSEDSNIDLVISDDGLGLPENFDMHKQQSLGMTLIDALSNQLEGRVSFHEGADGTGTVFRLRFKKKAD